MPTKEKKNEGKAKEAAARKAYLAEIKEVQEHYNPKSSRKASLNKRWEDDWKGFVEYTYPWDGGNALKVLVYRIEVLRAYFKHLSHHVGSEREVAEMDEAIAVGRRIIDDEYDVPAHDFLMEHTKLLAHVRRTESPTGPGAIPEATIELPREYRISAYPRPDPLGSYLKENGMREGKNAWVSFEVAWNTAYDEEVWRRMGNDSEKKKAADVREFFRILRGKLWTWWD